MRDLLSRALLAISSALPFYLISDSNARAGDWGCEVILCISNPGGPTQYAECEPPIHKLWSELAKGHSFPTCNGVGFRTSEPGYEPYYCDKGYRLTRSYGERGEVVACVSTSPEIVDHSRCYDVHDNYLSNRDGVSSAHWQRQGGRLECTGYVTVQPMMRRQPHYVDVVIDGIGEQRVWY